VPDLADVRVGFLVIGRKRPGFDPDWGRAMEASAWEALQSMTSGAVRPSTRSVDDATLREALEQLREAQCDALVVLQPTMGDGRLAPVLAQVWAAPLVLWATPERPDGRKVSACSLVGAHAFASLFRQMGRPFELAYGHPDETATRAQLAEAIRLTSTARVLRESKIGLVGTHAPGFINMQADAGTLDRDLGVQLHQFGLHEFIDLVRDQDEAAVGEDVQAVKELGLPIEDGLGDEDLTVNSRYYLAMCTLMETENLDALAVRCWPELPNVIGHWPYLAMARLADEGRVAALEGDVDGALSCLMAKHLGLGMGYISDWLEHDAATIVLWHPGNAVRDFCEPGSLRLGRHFNNDKPLVVNAVLKADMPITLMRVWRCDGRYRMTAHQAQTVAVRRELLGAHGMAVLEDRSPMEWFDTLCHEGMPHHLIVLRGHHAALLRRVARQLRLPFVG
jgi:L-fucose isomerase-like protein